MDDWSKDRRATTLHSTVVCPAERHARAAARLELFAIQLLDAACEGLLHTGCEIMSNGRKHSRSITPTHVKTPSDRK